MAPWFVDWPASLVGGLVGAGAMAGWWYALRAAGAWRLDMPGFLGGFFLPHGPRARTAGLAWHLLMGLAFGAVYALVLTLAGFTPGGGSGLVLGLLHAPVATATLAILARWRPAGRPGGRDWLLVGAGYPLFGAVFGATYAAWGTDALRYGLTALGLLALLLGVALVTYRLLPRWRAPHGHVFQSAQPDRAERRQALLRAHESGWLTESELEAGLADLEAEDRV